MLDIVTLGRAARNTAQIKNRQPLSKLIVVGAEALADEYIDLIEDELNVKEVTFQKDDSGLLDYAFKPQLKILGKKLGAKLPKVNEALRDIDGIKAMRTLKEEGRISITIDGEAIELTEEELIIEQKQREGLVSETDNGISVSLITTLTDDLIEEGFVREVISKVQTMRRESGFEVTDRIVLRVGNNEMLENVIDEDVYKRQAQYHYPFENKELFEEQFPADFISEAVDQTRGWFYTPVSYTHLDVYKRQG